MLIILFQPDTYIYAGWALLLLLTYRALRMLKRKKGKGRRIVTAIMLTLLWYFFIRGAYVEPSQIEVTRLEYSNSQVPEAFDGYRIVVFSDIHLGSCNGWRKDIVKTVADSINALQPDLVTFVGDLQNISPLEIGPHISTLRAIHARDGVVSVMGNHDYAMYLDSDDPQEEASNIALTKALQRQMGWQLLLNSNITITRGDTSHIVIAGMENDGEGRHPQLGDIEATLSGTTPSDFIIMLEHDPTSWQRKILTNSTAQLTLSGHTHGGQVTLFGWSPAKLKYKQMAGLFTEGQRALYVTRGIGGLIPFRFGTKPEIAVITLHHKPNS